MEYTRTAEVRGRCPDTRAVPGYDENARPAFLGPRGDSPMAAMKTLHVRVDRDRCQGHNRCKALAPELFELDELGIAREAGDGTVPPGLEDKAWLARANCPELAVEVTEDHTPR
jgi:ferredoxin